MPFRWAIALFAGLLGFSLLASTVRDIDGSEHAFPTAPGAEATIVFFVTSDCPISNRYAPEIGRICGEYATDGVRCLMAYVDPTLSEHEIREHRREYGSAAPAVQDNDRELIELAGATVTPEAALFDDGGRLAYLGRIDNLYAALGTPRRQATGTRSAHRPGGSAGRQDGFPAENPGDRLLYPELGRDPARRLEMKNSRVAAILACVAALGAYSVASGANSIVQGSATFNGEIASIVHQHCSSCHRPGQAAPFSLLTYEDVAKRAQLVSAVTQARLMPPWHAEPGYGSFKGERRLAEGEIELIARWSAAGAPRGQGDTPAPPVFSSDWELGEPDLVIRMEQPYTVPADGPDIYRNFAAWVPTERDQWVRAMQFRPQARAVVHHSLFKADTSGKARELDAQDDLPGFKGMGGGFAGLKNLGGWAVGGNARVFAEEAPLLLPAGSDFIFQSHFHPSGKQEVEVSSVAFYFTDKPPTRSRVSLHLPPGFGRGAGIDIAAGDPSFLIEDSYTLPAAVELYSVTPHAHYLGKEFRAWAVMPDGSEVPLIWIRDWDFSWQDRYVYESPVVLPAGTTIHARIRYDNSAENPRNPSSPPKRVKYGPSSFDEMGTIIFSSLPVRESDVPLIRQSLKTRRQEHFGKAREGSRARRERSVSNRAALD